MGTPTGRGILAAATALLWIFVALLTQGVRCFGIFELNLVSLQTDESCCSGCPRNCSLYLRFCISHYQATVDVNNPACTFKEFRTGPLSNDRPLDTMVFQPSFAWPGQFAMVIEAWRSPNVGGFGKELVSRFVVQKALEVGSEWTVDKLTNEGTTLAIKYRVVCKENYYGTKCDILCRIRDDKFGHNMCTSDGQMICQSGWKGVYCDHPICAEGCQNGTCTNPGECTCRYGWDGPLCDKCIPHPGCSHGRCISKPWQCICEEGWGGIVCDQDLNYCTNHKPCWNGGTCTNTGQGSYTCNCAEGYMGTNCEKPTNPCQSQPCQNGGICTNPFAGNYSCQCLAGFFGPHCDTSATICSENVCRNGATCIPDPDGYICTCIKGFKGEHCEKIDDCKVHHCLNGGTCNEHSDGFHCLCPDGVLGHHCEIRLHCSASPCENGGTCLESAKGVSCRCPIGFSGTQCQIKHNRCSSNPCANDAQCTNLFNGYRCDCKPGFAGTNCDHLDLCISSPCLNHGTCHVTNEGYNCLCHAGFHGSWCQLTEGTSNVSHRISEEEPLSGAEVALVISLSCVLVLLLLLICLVAWCLMRRRREQRQGVEVVPPRKICDLGTEEEQLQNERNLRHMNNKHCESPQKIVNDLDRVPAKVTNEFSLPPKVLNNQANGMRVPDRNSKCFQKIDNISGSSVSCHSPSSSQPPGAIYVIEDHLQRCPGRQPKTEDVLATEV